MKILLERPDSLETPQTHGEGTGIAITVEPSGSSLSQHDQLAMGLAELGHDVFYHVEHNKDTDYMEGVKLVDKLVENIDIVHVKAPGDEEMISYYTRKGIPVLATNHSLRLNIIPLCKWIHVSKNQANSHNDEQYVWNGLNPENYMYSSDKKDYVLFMANISDHLGKGLDIALNLSKELGFELLVAGSSKSQNNVDEVQQLCNAAGAKYIGDVRGLEKAKLFAEARAFLSPSRLQETFGLTLVEALFSGTPVICSTNGAYSEIMSKEVAFVCDTKEDYINAFKNIETIKPSTCRLYAMNNFHYLKTTEKYLKIYTEILMSEKKIKELSF